MLWPVINTAASRFLRGNAARATCSQSQMAQSRGTDEEKGRTTQRKEKKRKEKKEKKGNNSNNATLLTI